MKGYVARAMKAGLAREGEPALLAGAACGNVVVQRSVQAEPGMLGRADDNYVARFDLALIDAEFDPRVGQVLVHPDGTFRLDRLVDDNGVVRRFIVVRAQ